MLILSHSCAKFQLQFNSSHGSQTLAGPCFVPDPTFAAKRAGNFFRHQPAGNGGSRTLTEINTAILGKS